MTLLIQNIRLNNGHRSQLPDYPKPDQFVLVLWWSVIVVCTDETMVINVFCGVVSGVMSSCLANPTDVLKVSLMTSGAPSSFSEWNIPEQVKSVDLTSWCVFTMFQIRMQAQGSLLQGSMMSNFINIYQTEGTRGLWRVRAAAFAKI